MLPFNLKIQEEKIILDEELDEENLFKRHEIKIKDRTTFLEFGVLFEIKYTKDSLDLCVTKLKKNKKILISIQSKTNELNQNSKRLVNNYDFENNTLINEPTLLYSFLLSKKNEKKLGFINEEISLIIN